MCPRETNRRAGALLPKLTALHDGRVLFGLARYLTAWGSFHGREDDGRSVADVLHAYLVDVGRAALPQPVTAPTSRKIGSAVQRYSSWRSRSECGLVRLLFVG